MNNPQVAEYIQLLKDKDWRVHDNAIRTLGKMGVPAIPDLIEALKNQNDNVRNGATKALGEIADSSAISALREALEDMDPNVSSNAAEALGKIGAPAIPCLMQALNSENYTVRIRAVNALGIVGDVSTAPSLIEVLRDKDAALRGNAAMALGKIGESSAVPALIETLKDQHTNIRGCAVIALGKIGDVSPVSFLIEMLKDENHDVQREAAFSLTAIGKPHPHSLPRKILADSRFTAQQRIEVLEKLLRVRFKVRRHWSEGDSFILQYSFRSPRALCETVLREGNSEASVGAQTVLNWLNGDRDLTRPWQGGAAETQPETLLIPADKSENIDESRSTRLTLWQRLFAKRNRST